MSAVNICARWVGIGQDVDGSIGIEEEEHVQL